MPGYKDRAGRKTDPLPTLVTRFKDDWGFLSNFYPCPWIKLNFEPVVLPGDPLVYDSVEHAFQAAKASSLVVRERFTLPGLSAPQAKRMGRAIDCRPDWNLIYDETGEPLKVHVMRVLLVQKFSASLLRRKLLCTFSAKLEEGNWWHDTFWGICHGALDGHTCREYPHEPTGENMLGKLIMEVRSSLVSA